MEDIIRGAPRPYPTNNTRQREQCLKTAFKNRDDKTRIQYIRGIAQNIKI